MPKARYFLRMCALRSRALDDFLQLRAEDDDRFVASPNNHDGHVFGGETFGLATLAAARTCPDRPAHSLHMHFLRPAPADTPITFAVDRTREGRRIAHRRVEVQHDGRLFAQLVASFMTPVEGPDVVARSPASGRDGASPCKQATNGKDSSGDHAHESDDR